MTLLASRQDKASISIKDIAKATDISEKYLEQLFIQLKKGRLIESMQGSGGGYRLARDAGSIRAGDVFRAVESSFSLIPCLEEGECGRMDACVTRSIWAGLQSRIDSVVDGITLKDLADDLGSMPRTAEVPDYMI